MVDRLARIQHIDREGQFHRRLADASHGAGQAGGADRSARTGISGSPTRTTRGSWSSARRESCSRNSASSAARRASSSTRSDIAFDDKGRIFVSEFGDHDRIQVFDKDLHYLYEFGRFGGRTANSPGRSRW